jgi:hypothetical protein
MYINVREFHDLITLFCLGTTFYINAHPYTHLQWVPSAIRAGFVQRAVYIINKHNVIIDLRNGSPIHQMDGFINII